MGVTSEEFYLEHEPSIEYWVRYWGNRYKLSKEDREDVTQECRIKLWRHAEKVAAGKSALGGYRYWKAFINTLIRNTIYLWLERHQFNRSGTNSRHIRAQQYLDVEADKLGRNNHPEKPLETLRTIQADETLPDVLHLREVLHTRERLILDNILASSGYRFLLIPNLKEVTGLSEKEIWQSLNKIKKQMRRLGMTPKV